MHHIYFSTLYKLNRTLSSSVWCHVTSKSFKGCVFSTFPPLHLRHSLLSFQLTRTTLKRRSWSAWRRWLGCSHLCSSSWFPTTSAKGQKPEVVCKFPHPIFLDRGTHAVAWTTRGHDVDLQASTKGSCQDSVWKKFLFSSFHINEKKTAVFTI